MVNICAHLTLIGPCIGYLVLAGSNLSLLVCDYISTPLAIALCTAVLWPHVWLPTLTEVAVLSAFNVRWLTWLCGKAMWGRDDCWASLTSEESGRAAARRQRGWARVARRPSARTRMCSSSSWRATGHVQAARVSAR